MAEWIECSIGDLCNTISDTYKGILLLWRMKHIEDNMDLQRKLR